MTIELKINTILGNSKERVADIVEKKGQPQDGIWLEC